MRKETTVNRIKLHPLGAVLAISVLSLAGALSVGAGEQTAEAQEPQASPALLDPTLATATAPATYKVRLETTKGDVVIEVHREWAPIGADRFYNLVKIGYYDDTAFYRVISGFMAQVGFSGDPKVTAAWKERMIQDDPITQPNTRGMVTFAMQSTPNTRTTQFFINYGDNSYLKQHGNFAPFGKIIEGMEVVDSLYSGYGEGAPRGRGPSQMTISTEGNSYLKKSFPELDYIVKATVIE
jgi:peptidyl-prolyl cis-trans isomerase A (cyclophilin A)